MCSKCNESFYIDGIYNCWLNSTIDVSIITSSFLVAIFSFIIESMETSYKGHCLFSLKGHIICTLQRAIRWYTWKHIVGITFELCWSDSVLGISIHVHCSQHCITHFQWGNSYLDGFYAHIVVKAILDAVLNMCLPCGMTKKLHVSNRWLVISPDLFCAWRLWHSFIFLTLMTW